MATNTRKRPKPDYGKRLEARRNAIRKSLDDIVNETNGEIYKQLWYRVENGIKKPHTLTLPQIEIFARVLEWTPSQLADALEITLPNSSVKNFTPQPLKHVGNLEYAVIRGLGIPGESGSTLLTLEQLGDHKAEDCFTIVAGGGILACDQVKQILQPNYTAYFDKAMTPTEGVPVAYQIKGQERYIIMIYETVMRPRWVTSYDNSGAVNIRENEPELELLGVYWWGTLPKGWQVKEAVNLS